MSPDSYIKFKPGKFQMATLGWSSGTKWAYWIAIVYYRCHNHCKGLDNNDRYLQRVCQVESEIEWKEIKELIFDNNKYFVLDENGLWQQKEAEEDYAIDCGALKTYVSRGKKGAESKWKKTKI